MASNVSQLSAPATTSAEWICCWCEPERASVLDETTSPHVRFGMCRSCLDERLCDVDRGRAGHVRVVSGSASSPQI